MGGFSKLPFSAVLCMAQCLARVGGKERERDSISLSATGDSTARAHPPSSSSSSPPFSVPPFLSASVLETALPPCLAQSGFVKAGYPPCMSLDNIWTVAGGERGLETEAARAREKERKY